MTSNTIPTATPLRIHPSIHPPIHLFIHSHFTHATQPTMPSHPPAPTATSPIPTTPAPSRQTTAAQPGQISSHHVSSPARRRRPATGSRRNPSWRPAVPAGRPATAGSSSRGSRPSPRSRSACRPSGLVCCGLRGTGSSWRAFLGLVSVPGREPRSRMMFAPGMGERGSVLVMMYIGVCGFLGGGGV